MKIAICDDDRYFADMLSPVIEDYFRSKKIEFDIKIFSTGNELLSDSGGFDLIFLDIEMPGKDGMEVADIICKRVKLNEQKEVKVVFLTSHEEVVRKAFRVNAFRFLVKDSYKEEIDECLDAFCEEIRLNKIFVLNVDGEDIEVRQSDIVCITGVHNGVDIWTTERAFRQKSRLSYWEEQLDNGLFMRVHKSAVINIAQINYITDDEIIFMSGDKSKYSRRHKGELKKRFEQYVLEKAR